MRKILPKTAAKNLITDHFIKQDNLDRKLVFSLAKSRMPSFKQLKYVKKYLTKREAWLLNICLAVILVNVIFLGAKFYFTHLKLSPVSGGEYTEGVIGSLKLINPLYSTFRDTDHDITSLVFSSLFKRDKNGELAKDLAESYELSQDNKIYAIKLKQGILWHNGSPLTVDDVIFTFYAIKDKRYNSPLRASFSGVELERADDATIKFTLNEPYAAFLDLLTFGIIPQELWQQITPEAASLAELNLKPIGTGPYKFKSLIKDKSGNIRSYTLTKNEKYYLPPPYLNSIIFKFFGGTEELISALNNNLINGISYLPFQSKNEVVARDSLNFYQLSLPQLTAVFFNAKASPALADIKVRQALALALDKGKIVDEAMGQNGRVIDGPILPESFAFSPDFNKYDFNLDSSAKLLDDAGWKIAAISAEDVAKAEADANGTDEALKKQAEIILAMGTGQWRKKDNDYLAIVLTTADTAEYDRVAQGIIRSWQALNIKASAELIPLNQIQNEVIRPRNFSCLLYSEIVGGDPDPYGFWHSSQIAQSGLNIADYANKEVDKLLEEARLTGDINKRKENYKKFQQIIADELPAIFLYNGNYLYVQAKAVKGFNVKNILAPADRFANISEWYTKTGRKLTW